jgi:adenylylsulfate kinase|tara:strand:- start:864 stop:1268 length:405 start_codon:yes stop_codon:yes gene_type:complete
MGLPGAGKTHLAKRLHVHLNCAWYNADKVREMANDWDFSDVGRNRQSARMNNLALFEGTRGRTVICDFVCPTRETQNTFLADIVIWMDTIKAGRFADTNTMFEPPTNVDYHLEGVMLDDETIAFAKKLKEDYNV